MYRNDKWLVGEHSGYRQYLHQDPADENSFAFELEADVEPTIEHNKRLYNEDNRGFSPGGNIQRIASFPPIVIEIFKKRYGADPLAKGNEQLLLRLLNDPDLRHFRTAPGWV